MNAKLIKPRMLIDGTWISKRPDSEDVINPATEEVIGSFPHATRADLETAVISAEQGFRAWRSLTPDERCQVLLKTASLINERAHAIARTITQEQGKPLSEAQNEIRGAARLLEWDANEGKRAYGRVIPGNSGFMQSATREPIGVVAGFSPWNFPFTSAMRKLASPLAAGCSVILKAAEKTPATATALVECFVDAGIPKGVLTLIFGVPSEVSEFIIASPQVRMVTLTGSVPVGKKLASLAGSHMKPALMELGGHAPVLVCDDVDPSLVGRMAAEAKFRNAGQICTSPSRFIVHESVHDVFVETFVNTAKSLRLGDGLDEQTKMGPLVRSDRCDAMARLVENAVACGAKVRAGGQPHGNRGYFFEPTVLSDVPEDAEVMKREPFGPVAPITRFGRLEDAVSLANKLPYGLASYAFTNSASAIAQISEQIESGSLAVNHFGGALPETPFGGVKESGYGREGGIEGIQNFQVTKYISHNRRQV